MISYTLQQIADIVGGKCYGNCQALVEHPWFDSRHIVKKPNGLFFALSGQNQNGHQFIQDAYNKGVKNFVIEQVSNDIQGNYIVVTDTLKALQQWATHHRKSFGGDVLGITGTHGKTIVKEWLYHLLFQEMNVMRSPKSYNSQIGVPLSVLEMESNAELSILELGISQPNEMGKIAKIACPDLGLLTMVGNAHTQFFENKIQHVQEKLKLFDSCETIIYPFDDELIWQEVSHLFPNKKSIGFGTNKNADIRLISDLNDKQIKINYNHKTYEFDIPFFDKASVYNALCCFAVLTQLDVDLNQIIQRFKTLPTIEMRLEQKEGINNTIIIDDTFNSDLSSIPIALNVLNAHPNYKKTLILTDVVQDRLNGEELYQKVAHWVNAYPIQKMILIGNEISKYQHLFHTSSSVYQDTQEFLSHINTYDFQDEVILLKGARKFNLEKISKVFQKKSHETILEVNLKHLSDNIKYFKSKLNPSTQFMGMVKANGYGLGSVEIAQTLIRKNATYLGVAYADEGAELRAQGITVPIMVMNPEQNSYQTIIQNQLEPEVYGFRMLENFVQSLQQKNIQEPYPIHIKLNTGMNRLGFKENDIPELIATLNRKQFLKVKSVFSHFATSDMPNETDFVHQQANRFECMYQTLVNGLGYQPFRHISNSSATLNFPKYQMDMVRLGIGMYGITSDKLHQKYLQNVVTFKTVISQITNLEKGESVSYGRNFKAVKPTKIATLPVGYADGVKRILSNGIGKVLINHQPSPIIGNICMDMLMVDITAVDCKEGDEVIIFGDGLTIQDIADLAQTIPYEILTSISSRVKRVYYYE